MGKRKATITKKELVERIAEETKLTQVLTREVIQTFLDTIVKELAAGHRLELRDFGVFLTRKRRSRRARNPRTGEEVSVVARTVVSFRPSRHLREEVDPTLGQEKDT